MTARISQYVVTKGRYSRRSQSGRVTPGAITLTLGITTLLMVATLSFFYLQQVLHTASQGSDVHTLESTLIEIKQKQRELELEGAQLRSLQNVEERVHKLNLAPTDRVTYLIPTPDHVALFTQ